DGVALCTATGSQQTPTVASDGAGGAIVTWFDNRGGSFDIYVQHISSAGVVDPAWPANGRALCTASSDQARPVIVPDGAGGAILAWEDDRNGPGDIYAQHLLATGAVDGGWPADGRALCSAADIQGAPAITSDGAGGAIVTWYDRRSAANYDIYAQHLL